MQQLSVSGTQWRRSPRLQAKAGPSPQSNPTDAARNETLRPSRARADQFCVYNTSNDKRVAAFVIEYKASHKIPLGFIYEGLDDMDLDRVVQHRENEGSKGLLPADGRGDHAGLHLYDPDRCGIRLCVHWRGDHFLTRHSRPHDCLLLPLCRERRCRRHDRLGARLGWPESSPPPPLGRCWRS